MFSIQTLAQQQPVPVPLPTDGRLDGTAYQSSFFGFKYFVPDTWVGRSSTAKLPGVTNGYFLMQAKRKVGDPLSSLTIMAFDLTAYSGKLEKFIDDRYRPKAEPGESETSFNGVRLGRSKPAEVDRELLLLGDRSFYKISTESTGVERVSIVTSEKGYALVFEMIVPSKYQDDLTPGFIDSLHSLEFKPAATATANK